MSNLPPISFEPVNFSPTMQKYSGQGAFRFWCQTVLPLIYDDSLSYYELLNKVVVYLNKTIEDVGKAEDNIDSLNTSFGFLQNEYNLKTFETINRVNLLLNQFTDLKNYVDNYFDNLDTQAEIEAILDNWVASGEFSDLLYPVVRPMVQPFVATEVSNWLTENVDPVGSAVIVDNTLTVSGAAADAKIVGDNLAKKFDLDIENCTAIEDETDYDTLTTPGNYIVTTATSARSMVNCPVTVAHKMYVIKIISGRLVQIIYANATSTVPEYRRFYNGSSWSIWFRVAYRDDIPTVDTTLTVENAAADAKTVGDDLATIKENLTKRLTLSSTSADGTIRIPASTDYNTIRTIGNYVCSTTSDASSMINTPTNSVHRLFVMNGATSARFIQIIITASANTVIFKRYFNGTSWSAWSELATTNAPSSMANNTSDGLKLLSTAKKTQTEFVPLKSVPGFSSINANQTYKGVLYKGVHYYSRDALYNYNLETYFSLFNNENSLLYDFDVNAGDGPSYTGAVCSSFVSWLTGQPIYYTTFDIIKMLEYKTINDLSDLEIGDVLISSTTWGDREDHAMIVSNIYSNSDGITNIEIMEGWSPTSRTLTYDPSQVWGLFNGTTRSRNYYRVGRIENTKIRTIPALTINKDIVSERGDNTYFELGEDVFIQSAQNSFTVKSPSGNTQTVNFTDLPLKENTNMRNIKTVLNEVGTWTLYGSNSEESHITIIKKGTATLTDGTVSLSGYEGCTPCGFAVVGVMAGQHGAYKPYMEGDYSAQRVTINTKEDPRYAGVISSDNFDINLTDINNPIPTYPRIAVYVRIFYDTGCGQAWQDTNLQSLT